MSIYQNNFVFEKHGPYFSDYIGLCIKHHKDEKGENTEFHHIFPEHKGGTNIRWNMVHLEYELHVEAHRLLMEAFPDDDSMRKAYNYTKNRGSNRGEGNPMFGKMSGELNPMFGRTGELHPAFGNGHLISGERNGMFGRTGELHPNFGRTGELSPMFGRTGELSPRFGIEPWNKGKSVGERKRIKCEHCGGEFALTMYARWHGPKCKHLNQQQKINS
jgi:hypothetical protein